jgi:hypothetical protein
VRGVDREHGSGNDFERRDLVALQLEEESKVNGTAGKIPRSLLVTTIFPSGSSHANGALVNSNLAATSVLHRLIAT